MTKDDKVGQKSQRKPTAFDKVQNSHARICLDWDSKLEGKKTYDQNHENVKLDMSLNESKKRCSVKTVLD